MKRSKKLGIMLGVLAAVCAMALAVSMVQEKQEHIEISGETILSIPVDSVRSFLWTEGENTLGFHRTETGWTADEDGDFPASADKVEALLKPYEAFGAGFTIEEVEDPGLYGLDDPTAVLCIETEDRTYELTMGDYSKMDAQRYVSIGDGKVYLAAHDPCDDFSDTTLRDLVLDDTVPAFEDKVEKLRFTGAETYELTRQEQSESYRPEDLWYTERDGKKLALDPGLVEDYIAQLNSGMLYNYTDYHAEGEELAAYGLSEPELTVEVFYGADTPFTIHLGRDQAQVQAWEVMTEEERETAEPIPAFAQVEGSHIVYRLDSTTWEALSRYRADDLRHREVLPAGMKDVKQVEFTLDGETCLLTARQKDGETVWSQGEQELTAEHLTDALTGLRITEFSGDAPGDRLELSFTAQLAAEGDPEVKVELYRRDGSSCLAVVDGAPLGLVSRADTMELVEAVNRILLDRKP